ncbi:MAG: 30S ribosomal protein S21 [Phycisphaerales bacterium]|jgi:small subunit ribosomal protein S21
MAIRVKSRSNESTEQMLRRFKKLCEKEGLVKDIKRKEYYEKPSERNRRDMRKAIGRRIREALIASGELKPMRPSRQSRG